MRQSIVLKTHPDFKSADKGVRDANDMYEMFQALRYQSYYQYRMTTPEEMHLWDFNELTNFKLDLELIDRLYYIKFGVNHLL